VGWADWLQVRLLDFVGLCVQSLVCWFRVALCGASGWMILILAGFVRVHWVSVAVALKRV